MATPIRTLVNRLVLDGKAAFRDLKLWDRLTQQVADNTDKAAARMEKAAARMAGSMRDISAAMQAANAAARSGGGAGGGGGARGGSRGGGGGDPIAAVMREAREQERAAKAAERQARSIAATEARKARAARGAGIVDGRAAGLAAGAVPVNEATAALGRFATASDKAKAKVADLSAQVSRNRKDMADLKEQILRTGDADGTLTGKMQGLATKTGQVNVQLQAARRELRAVDGSLIDTIKNTANFEGRMTALRVAAGNLISAGISRVFHAVGGAIVDATKKAIDFESAFADVKKVLPDNATAEQIAGVEKSIVDLSKRVAVDGPEGAAKLTAALVQTGLYADETGKLAEDALARAAEFAAKTGVAFDISAGQAGEGLAKLQTSAGLSQEGIERLAGTINHLSNNMAAKAPEILDAATRVGGIGKAAGVSAETMAALSTAMIASGGSAETAATGTKNFIRAIGSGAAATKKQREAFAALGVDAEETAAKFSHGGKEAEAVIKDIVERIAKVPAESRLSTLIQLFGSETIGTIGPLATNIDLLTKSFALAGDETAALTSVQKEYDSRSKTTANAVQLLKNNVSALAIQFGNALLPYINEVVAFLTSPEGQEWGRGAVESAVGAVTSLASGLKELLGFFGSLTEKIGGTGAAVAVLGVAIAGLAGPMGLALAAGVALGAGIAKAVDSAVNRIQHAQTALLRLHNEAQAIRAKETDAERAAQVGESDAASDQLARERRAQAATDLWEQRQRARGGVARGSKEDLAITRKAARMRGELLEGRFDSGSFEDRIGAFEASIGAGGTSGAGASSGTGVAPGGGVAGIDRFNELISARTHRQLKPSEARELRELSKRLDVAIPNKPGKGHKATRMDRQLAAMDPTVAGLLRQGGEEDAGGDLKVASNVLDRAVFDRATKGSSGSSGGASLGAGPNITNTYYNNQVSIAIAQEIDARGEASASENLRAAGGVVAQRAAESVRFTGIQELKAARNIGGRIP